MRWLLPLLICAAFASASPYSVVIAASVKSDTLSQRQLRDIFLLKRQFLGEQKVIPVNLLADNEARLAFEQAVLNMGRDKLGAYWVKQHFAGVSPPLTQASYEALKLFIVNVPGAIGYLPSSMVDEKVRVLYEF